MRPSSSPPSSPPSLASSLSDSREASPMPPTDTVPHATLHHPFAATSHAAGVRPPKYYIGGKRAKRARRPSNQSDDMDMDVGTSAVDVVQPTYPQDVDMDEENALHTVQRPGLERSDEDATEDAWDEAVTAAVDRNETTIELSQRNLTHISACVEDLSKLVILAPAPAQEASAFTRVNSTPSDVSARVLARNPSGALFSRSGSQRSVWGATTRDVGNFTLFLARNNIRCLPPELFTLSDRLAVLSLWYNKLEELPAAIGQLRVLRELNVAGNELKTIPIELDDLHLNTLTLIPNKFIDPPSDQDTSFVWETRELPSLQEFSIRVLLDPARNYDRETFARDKIASYPGYVPFEYAIQPEDAVYSIQYNKCRAHGRHFVLPGHTRLEFRSRIAGCDVGMRIPLLHRGCMPGCLDEVPEQQAHSERDSDDAFMDAIPEL